MNKSGTSAVPKTQNDLREERMLKSINTLLENRSEDTYSHVSELQSLQYTMD